MNYNTFDIHYIKLQYIWKRMNFQVAFQPTASHLFPLASCLSFCELDSHDEGKTWIWTYACLNHGFRLPIVDLLWHWIFRGSFLFFIHWHNPNTWAMLMDMGLSWAYLSTHTCWFDNGLTFWALFRLVPAARLINHKGQAQGFWALFHGSCVALKTQLGPNLRFICMGNEPIWMGPRLEIWFF